MKDKLNKKCEFCGKTFFQKEKQSDNKFKKQRFCSRKCVSQYSKTLPHVIEKLKQKRVPDRTLQNKKCIICGKIFYRPDNYSNSSWKKKETCTRICHSQWLSNERTNKPLGIRTSKIINCNTCGKEVIISKYKLEKFETFYCSKECFNKSDVIKECGEKLGNNNKGKKKTLEQIEKMKASAIKGEEHHFWKGGVTYRNRQGNYSKYKIKYVSCPDKFKEMSRKDGYVTEHRLLVAQIIGRYLKRSECVHHIDHNPENNDISNLMLFKTNSEHKKYEFGNKDIEPLWEYKNEQNI